jgi:hypothetical protein
VVRYLTRRKSRRVSHAVLIAHTTPFTMKTNDNPGGTPREDLKKFRELSKDDLPHRAKEAAPDFFEFLKRPFRTRPWTRIANALIDLKLSFRTYDGQLGSHWSVTDDLAAIHPDKRILTCASSCSCGSIPARQRSEPSGNLRRWEGRTLGGKTDDRAGCSCPGKATYRTETQANTFQAGVYV